MNNDVLLKGNEIEIASDLVPYIYGAISDSIAKKYKISKTELATALLAISFSEGSRNSKKGAIVFQSPLVLKGNNPFGIKGKGIKTKTFEYINGQKVLINSSFRRFESISESIWFISTFIGSSERYKNARKAITGEAFLIELQKAGYATSPDWFNKFTIPIYRKIIKVNDHRITSIYWYRRNQ